MKILILTLCILSLFIPAFGQKSSGWKISDYLKNLPQEYKTFSGDFQTEPNDETTLIDDKNGYAAYFSQPKNDENAYPIFEIALFKKSNGEEILVISNLKSDPVCSEYETFLLQRKGDNWIDVKAKVLPEFTAQMFFDSANTAKEFIETQKKVGNSTELNLHFSPPRQGTKMNVKLEICDYVPDELSGEVSFQKFLDSSKTISLDWNKSKGVFAIK